MHFSDTRKSGGVSRAYMRRGRNGIHFGGFSQGKEKTPAASGYAEIVRVYDRVLPGGGQGGGRGLSAAHTPAVPGV